MKTIAGSSTKAVERRGGDENEVAVKKATRREGREET